MKPRQTLLQKIHSWPEETRRLMAFLSTAVSGIIVLVLLGATINMRLTHPPASVSVPRMTPPSHTTTLGDAETLSPMEGLRDSFASLKGMLLPEDLSENNVVAGHEKGLLQKTGILLHDSLVGIGNYIIGGWLIVWHTARDPDIQKIITKKIVFGVAALDRGIEQLSQYVNGPF